jgi:AraC-like DNA-binding protein
MSLLLPTLTAFVLAFLFLIRGKSKQNKTLQFLGLYFLLWTGTILCFFLATEKLPWLSEKVSNVFILFFFVFLLSIPPTMYLYTTFLAGIRQKGAIKHYFIIFLLFFINAFSFFYMDSEKNLFMKEMTEKVLTYSNYLALLFVFPLLSIYYLYLSVLVFKNYKREKEIDATSPGIDSKKLLYFIVGYILFMVLLLINLIGILPKFLKISFELYSTVYFMYVAYISWKQEQLDFEVKQEQIEAKITENFAPFFEGLEEKLSTIMTDEKPFLDAKLTLNQLAKKIGSNEKYLSLFLNSKYEMNFASYINSYRIEEAKQLLVQKETANYTIETIANMAGFYSKSTFNTAFKKATGSTPSEFKNGYTSSQST